MDSKDTNENEKEIGENTSSISSDLIRGHINTIILRTLYDGDKYGYEIINEIEEKSKGQYTLKQPTLYSALKRLESQDFVTSYWGGASNGGRRKYFQITDKGRTIVEQNLAEWEYSRTVIDSLISEKDYDFSNPPPAASVDFSLLKKSTTRVPMMKGGEEENDIELAASEPEAMRGTAPQQEEAAEQSQSALSDADGANSFAADGEVDSSAAEPSSDGLIIQDHFAQEPLNDYRAAGDDRKNDTYAETVSPAAEITAPPPEESQPIRPQTIVVQEENRLSEEEKQRIHENYKVLIGDDSDATSYYYSHVAKKRESEPAAPPQQPAPPPQETPAPVYNGGYYEAPQPYGEPPAAQAGADYAEAPIEENASAADMLYANKSPAERNYKSLLSRLYDNATKNRHTDEEFSAPSASEEEVCASESPSYASPAENPAAYAAESRPEPVRGNRASNIEFYDVAEKAENEGLKITTTNGAKNRTAAKSVGNTFNKGKALFITAVYVFIVALAESIVNICLKGVLKSNDAYVIIPFVIDFVMLGVFLFLYLRGYGKNSRKAQSKSYISASLIVFINLVLLVCLIVYLVTVATDVGLGYMKYAIFPCVYIFNIPLFAILYNYNCNKN